ncbi:hypothetical protein B0H34DRAFT_799114 [Crassisporium funariophilum]|nr:hypothetical protein B0H34DRAFT_799114 [Crassisporium funariophilum]
MDHAVQYLMQFHEASLVEIAVAALWKEDVNCDMRKDFETKAVVLTIEPRESLEDMEAASAAGRIPPFQLSRTTSVVLQEEEARRLGSDISIFEHPFTRTMRMRRDKIGVAMIFQPSGRIFTQAVPKIQLAMWEMGQGHEKKTTNPPMVYWHVMMTNGTIKREIEDERKKKDEVMQVASSST